MVKAMVFPVVMYGFQSWTKENLVPRIDVRQEDKGTAEDEMVGRHH